MKSLMEEFSHGWWGQGLGDRRKHVAVFGADADEVGVVGSLGEVGAGVGAAEGEGVAAGELVPELLEAYGGFAFAVSPEDGDHLSEGYGAGCVGAEAGFRLEEERLDGVEETVRIGPAVAHEFRERGVGVEEEVLVIADGEGEIDAAGAEALSDALAVRSGGDDQTYSAGVQSGDENLGEAVEKDSVVLVELD
jgi:hypothetical protein